MKRLICALLGALLFSVPGGALAGGDNRAAWGGWFLFHGSDGKAIAVPYVSTHGRVVEQMLDLTHVRDGDVVYDLGCGDGRIVIGAAARAGVRGVGIDLDPKRIEESRANARAAGVGDRVTFIHQDLFEADIREATVVTLYLLTEINVRLRPKLFRDLQPGTRIVSHNFDMGEWKADRYIFVDLGRYDFHELYFWVLPANVSGVWKGTTPQRTWSATIRQRFQRIEGNISIDGEVAPISNASITGNVIRFSSKTNTGGSKSITFEGKVSGHQMEGSLKVNDAPPVPCKAMRHPASASSISD